MISYTRLVEKRKSRKKKNMELNYKTYEQLNYKTYKLFYYDIGLYNCNKFNIYQ